MTMIALIFDPRKIAVHHQQRDGRKNGRHTSCGYFMALVRNNHGQDFIVRYTHYVLVPAKKRDNPSLFAKIHAYNQRAVVRCNGVGELEVTDDDISIQYVGDSRDYFVFLRPDDVDPTVSMTPHEKIEYAKLQRDQFERMRGRRHCDPYEHT